ncbi:MAG: hypothetical protein JWR24_5076 [Actinoallomurus sp.]|jgi:hypothetical protein|nr:hypothetical protein [Actinoallomurus sp.]
MALRLLYLIVLRVSGTTTFAPAGSDSATGASIWETAEPTATSSASAPTSRANAARARPVEAS